MAEFKVSNAFKDRVKDLRTKVPKATEEAVGKAIFMIAQDAKAEKRWRDEGAASYTDEAGNTWDWTVTGLSEDLISAYLVTPNKRLPSTLRSFSRPDSNVYINGRHVFTKKHRARPPSMTARQANKVTGVITMYSEYARWLQLKERKGTKSGTPGPGTPITVDIIKRRWRGFYIPNVVRPILKQILGGS
jgi:hypothetical protein